MDGVEWVIPLRLLRLLEHLAVLKRTLWKVCCTHVRHRFKMIWAPNCVKWLWRWCTSKFTKTSAGFDELWNKLLVYHWGRGKLRHMWVDMNEWKTLWCCHAWLNSRVVSYKYSSLVVAEWMQDIRTMLCFPDSPLILWRLSLILLMAAALNDIQRETEASSFS